MLSFLVFVIPLLVCTDCISCGYMLQPVSLHLALLEGCCCVTAFNLIVVQQSLMGTRLQFPKQLLLLLLVCRFLPMTPFGGPLPAAWGDLKEVQEIDVSYNYASGTLPSSWGKLNTLQTL